MDGIKARQSMASRLWETSPRARMVFVLCVVLALSAAAAFLSSYLPLKIALATVAGLIVFVLVCHSIQFGLVLCFVLNLTIPQAGPGLDIGLRAPMLGERGIHFNLHEMVMAMVLVSWIIHIVLKKATWRERSPLILPIVLFVLVNILSCFVGLVHDAIIWVVIFRFFRTAFFSYAFFVVLNNVRTRRHYQQLVVAFFVCTFLVSIFGIVQSALGQRWTEMVTAKVLGKMLGYPESVNYVAGGGATQVYRISSSFVHPNVFGGYLVFALPFYVSFLSMMFRKQRWWLVLLLLVGLGMNIFCLVYSGSRAAWIAAGCIVLLYGVLGVRDRRIVLVAVTALLILALIVVAVKPPDFIKKRFTSQSARLATTGRMMQYMLALDVFMDHPIFGLGTGMEGQRIMDNGIRRTWESVENLYLTYLVSEGLVGLASFLLILVFFWALLLWARSRSEDDPFIRFNAEALMLGMVGFAVANLFGSWLLYAAPMISLFWFFTGMAGSLYNLFREGKEGW